MRLIDADGIQELFNVTSSALLSNPELTKDVEHMVRAFLMVSEMISDASTVDAEPIVRCKDCKWYETQYSLNGHAYTECSYLGAPMDDNDFCSCGKRRER